MPEIDWQSEINSMDGSPADTLRRALVRVEGTPNIKHALVLLYTEDEESCGIGYESSGDMTYIEQLWILEHHRHRIIAGED